MQTIEQINAIVTLETGLSVALGISPHDQSEFLRLYRDDPASDEKVFVTSLPRETEAGVICAFGAALQHYYRLGQAPQEVRDRLEAGELKRLGRPGTDEEPDDAIADFTGEVRAEIEAGIAMDKRTYYCIKHRYDIGDQRVFVRRVTGDVDPVRAAVYLQFLCEEFFEGDKMLSNLGVAALLIAYFGFQHTAATTLCTEIDMYADREKMCGAECAALMADLTLHRDGLREAMAPHVAG